MDLIIVESPTKAKALRGFLGRNYRIMPTMGHIRDLPPKELGVDVKHDFQPTYWYRRGGKKQAQRIKNAAHEAKTVYLATDPDREGEAIAWHVAEAIKPALRDKATRRISFHEITDEAVRAALAAPSSLDIDLVNAQQTRRILDRLVGYQVSPVLWKAIKGPKGLSAGRVQTVALRLVVERDREIENFDPEEYWILEIELSPVTDQDQRFRARLVAIDSEKADLRTEEDVRPILERISTADYRVLNVNRRKKRRRPYPPYTTSTLQRDASHKLHWSSSKTMRVAQQLYEGVDLPGEGALGLITYMRTDSSHVAASAQEEARETITRYWGGEYVPSSPPHYKTKSKVAQEAHEAIRPTSCQRVPTAMREHLTADQAALYEWIWRRFIASQMKSAIYHDTTVEVACSRGGRDLPYLFRASGRELLFKGFMEVYPARWSQRSSHKLGAANQNLPSLAIEEPLLLHDVIPEQRFTEPPSHFTESSLIKDLEKQGIGRPSTYAGIVRTLFKRRYVQQARASIQAAELGFMVCDFLVEQFPDLFAVTFTAEMEEELDRIARGEQSWLKVLHGFYDPFEKALAAAQDVARRGADPRQLAPPPKGSGASATAEPSSEPAGPREGGPGSPADETCPACGGDVVIREGKYGKFKGCSNFPRCRWTSSCT